MYRWCRLCSGLQNLYEFYPTSRTSLIMSFKLISWRNGHIPFPTLHERPCWGRFCTTSVWQKRNDHPKEHKTPSYVQSVSILLVLCVTDDIIVEAGMVATNFKQPEHISALRYSEVLWRKPLSYCRGYKKTQHEIVSFERHHESVWFPKRTCWVVRKDARFKA